MLTAEEKAGPKPSPLLDLTIKGRWRIVFTFFIINQTMAIGKGAFGEVFQCEDLSLSENARPFAVKVEGSIKKKVLKLEAGVMYRLQGILYWLFNS